MAVVFEKTKGLTDAKLHYCPGCAHGIVHRLVAEVLEEMGELGNSIVAVPVGCAVFANNYFNIDAIQCAHGRAPATATGIKRVHPEQTVFTYQGDGDLASIGTCEIVHAAARKDYNNLHQQRYLRHDRRPDGSHNSARHESNNSSERP